MKKICIFLATLLIALSLFGCSNPNTQKTSDTPKTNQGQNQQGQGNAAVHEKDPYVSLLLNKNVNERLVDDGKFSYMIRTDKNDIQKGYVVIYGYKGGGGFLEIPNSLGGYPVVVIKNSIFKGRSDIVDIVFPDSLREIEFDDFEEGKNVQLLGDTQWLQGLPDGFCHAGKVFIGHKGELSADTELKIREGIVSVANGALRSVEAKNITSVKFPDSMRYISEYSFSGTSVKEVTVESWWQKYNDAFPEDAEITLADKI